MAKESTPQRPLLRGKIHLSLAIALPFLYPFLYIWKDHPDITSAYTISFFTSISNFIASSLLHFKVWDAETTSFFRRLDYASIFLNIGGAYLPSEIIILRENIGFVLMILIRWILIVYGILSSLSLDFCTTGRDFRVYLYSSIALPSLYISYICFRVEYNVGAILILFSFLLYGLGGHIYITRYPDPYPHIFGFHELFHLLCLQGYITSAYVNYSITKLATTTKLFKI